MLSSRLHLLVASRILGPKAIMAAHSRQCPEANKSPKKGPICPDSKGGGGGGDKQSGIKLTRALTSGKVRLAFVPEEWFQFFHSKTGVTGPYIFGIVLANYLVSKEIFIMEHEYYLGLSWLIVMGCTVKYIGPGFASWLDKEVDDYQASFDNSRNAEIDYYQTVIKSSKEAQWMAEGQKLLMDAKKENIAMQIEAAYRERCMMVYKSVKGRMDYHVKRYRSEARIHQKWMIGWILENVRNSITLDFEKQALQAAIQELSTAAGRSK